MIIKMTNSKDLLITVPTTIFCGENNADLITFMVPATYEDVDFSDCVAVMHYRRPDGSEAEEPLVRSADLYKSYLQYGTEVDTQFASLAGGVTIWLTFKDLSEQVVLKTEEVTVYVFTADGGEAPEYVPLVTQANWAQDDQLAPDYIKNKPDIAPSLFVRSNDYMVSSHNTHEILEAIRHGYLVYFVWEDDLILPCIGGWTDGVMFSATVALDDTSIIATLIVREDNTIELDESTVLPGGVYVGSGDMPYGYNVQIDPDGELLTEEELIDDILGQIAFISNENLLCAMAETGIIDPITDENGAIFLEDNETIFVF